MVLDQICRLFLIMFYRTTHRGVDAGSFLLFLPWPALPAGKSLPWERDMSQGEWKGGER